MVQQQSARAEDFWWAEPATQQKLLTDPIGVLKEMGINVPANVPIPVAQEVVRLNSLLWLDGQVISRDQFKIDPADEGLLFGRGVWESTRVIGGLPWLWSMHIERLKKTAELLRIEVEPERLPDSMAVSEFVRSLTKMDVVIRLNLTAGRPGKKGIVWMTAALPPAPLHGVRLQTRTLPMEKGHPYLLWKTFQYATRLEVGQQSMREGFDTCLLVDEQDNLLEAAHANLFVRLQDGWATPLPDGGLLPGTVRRQLLERSPLPIREMKIPRAFLGEVTEAFVTNSNVGIVPVTQIDDRSFPLGAETQQLQQWLRPAPAQS